MENTYLLPSTKQLNLSETSLEINQPSSLITTYTDKIKKQYREKIKCVMRNKIVNMVIFIFSCIIFVTLLCFMYLGKFIHW